MMGFTDCVRTSKEALKEAGKAQVLIGWKGTGLPVP